MVEESAENFLEGFKHNFDQLRHAVINNDVCLMHCRDKNGGDRAVVCAVFMDSDGKYNFVPFAEMLQGNPYEYLKNPEDWCDKPAEPIFN